MTGVLPTFRAFPGVHEPDTPIGSIDELAAFHAAGAKPIQEHRVGVEWERLPLLADGSAAPFAGAAASVENVLRVVAQDLGLECTLVGEHVLGLVGDSFAVHLEPGAQVELALNATRTASEQAELLDTWRESLVRAAAETGVHLIALAVQPVTPVTDIPWVPKERYGLMRERLARTGSMGHHMMKATASLQVGLDYRSEADAGRKLHAVLALSPVVNAMVVNGPLLAGVPNGELSLRPRIWSQTDPARCGLLPWVFDGVFTFRRWVDWALSAPPFFVVRDGAHVTLDYPSFAHFLNAGHPMAGVATHADYQLHLTTLFPEARIKQHLEIRGQDSCSAALAAGLAALWHSVLRDEDVSRKAEGFLPLLTAAERDTLFLAVGHDGLRARLGDFKVIEAAEALLDLAASAASPADVALLKPLQSVVEHRRTPADELLAEWAQGRGTEALLARL